MGEDESKFIHMQKSSYIKTHQIHSSLETDTNKTVNKNVACIVKNTLLPSYFCPHADQSDCSKGAKVCTPTKRLHYVINEVYSV